MRTSRSRTCDTPGESGRRLAPMRSCTYRLMRPCGRDYGWFKLSRGASVRTRVSCTPGSAPTMFEVEDHFVKHADIPSRGTVHRGRRYRALLSELAPRSGPGSRTGEPARPGRPQRVVPQSGGVLSIPGRRAVRLRPERKRPLTRATGVYQELGSIPRGSSAFPGPSERLASQPPALYP